MKFYCKLRLVLGCTAAIGWFVLHDISFGAVLFLIPIAMIYYRFARNQKYFPLLNGSMAMISAGVAAYAVAVGLFEGRGALTLLFLLFAVGIGAVGISKTELSRISGWWCVCFIAVYALMFAATLTGISMRASLPALGDLRDIAIFYLLAFAEPFSLGKEYRGSPLILGMLLIPFAIVGYLALGEGAFSTAQYPYLSVWSGVAVSAFHHLEGIILCFYYGLAAFRVTYFFAEIKKIRCIRLGDML